MMDVEAQCELIRQFMLAIAPEVTAHSLEAGTGLIENAGLILESSMQLAARYNELYETLTAPTPDTAQKSQLKTPAATERIHKPQARISVAQHDVSDLRQTHEQRRPSPLSPDWKPPEHNR